MGLLGGIRDTWEDDYVRRKSVFDSGSEDRARKLERAKEISSGLAMGTLERDEETRGLVNRLNESGQGLTANESESQPSQQEECMASVFVKVPGRAPEEVSASNVAEVRTLLSGRGVSLDGYSASVNGARVVDDTSLTEGQAVVFTKDTKGGC